MRLFKGQDEESEVKYKEQVTRTGDFADYMYANIKNADGSKGLARIQKEYTYDGLLTSVGFPEVYYDPELEEIVIDTNDPFDIYVLYPNQHFHDNLIVWKVAQKYISDLKNNKRYDNTKDLKADNLVTQSQVKKMLYQARYQSDESGEQDDDVSTCLVKQTFMVVKITEEYLKELQASGYDKETIDNLRAEALDQKRVRIVSYTDKNPLPIRDEFVDDDECQIGIYSADVNSRETYGEGWVRNLRPLNMVLNRVSSAGLDYMNTALKYKLTMPKGSEVETITSDNGEIIEYKMGAQAPFQLRQDPLPAAYYTLPDQYWNYMQTIGGSHDQFLGQGGGASESGRHAEAIRAGDAQNLADLRDNNELTLIWIMNRILKLVNRHYVDKKLIEINGKSFYVVGEQASKRLQGKGDKKEKDKDVLVIGDENSVKVDIGSWLAQTLSAKQDFLMELYDKQILAREDVLENIEYGDVQGAVERVRNQIALEGQRPQEGGAMPQAGAEGIPPESMPEAQGSSMEGDETIKSADTENRAMIAGEIVPPTPVKYLSPKHVQIHEAAMKSQIPEKAKGYIQAHLEADTSNLKV
jgi:hypothetical protein